MRSWSVISSPDGLIPAKIRSLAKTFSVTVQELPRIRPPVYPGAAGAAADEVRGMLGAMRTDAALAKASRFLVVGVDEEGTGEIGPILEFLDEVAPLGVILFRRNIPGADAL